MPRRPVREFLARIPLLGRLWRRYRTVTAYGETFCPGDFTLRTDNDRGEPWLVAHRPDDRSQAHRLQPHVFAEWRLLRELPDGAMIAADRIPVHAAMWTRGGQDARP